MKQSISSKLSALSLAIALTSTFASTSVLASANSTSAHLNKTTEATAIYEKPSFLGLSGGMVAGAIVAGPLGAVVAGTIGLLIGNTEEIDEQRERAESNLANTNQALSSINQQKQHLLTSLKKAEQQNQHLNKQLTLASNTINSAETLEQMKLNLQFKVNSSDVESFYQAQVKQLAQLVTDNPNLKIQLSGHADRNGDENHNLQLSEQRVAAVKALLVAQGISEENIETSAFGESAPMQAQQDYQNDFYDRRVEVKLQTQQVLTAGN
ncbi:MAG: sortase-associated OmpA-like protein PdsO [Thalassotalea sp.]